MVQRQVGTATVSKALCSLTIFQLHAVIMTIASPSRINRPVADSRGQTDTVNFVSLLTEMRAAFGTKYGISLTLAPDYWYLRGFDPKAMEASVDFFGFMSYDLHGSWDADVKTLGSLVRPQTDIREIANDSVPLWFDNLDPAKINFGLASYGRGYTLTSSSCAYFGCPFVGPSKPMQCTAFAGVASNTEIKNIIEAKDLVPELVPDTMVKQITWDDQWIGYDDDETFALKRGWADSHCFGGTMLWSIDMDSVSGSGDIPDRPSNTANEANGPNTNRDPGGIGGAGGAAGPARESQGAGGSADGESNSSAGSADLNKNNVTNVFIDPSIWKEQNPVVMCNPPCQFIFPPYPIQGDGIILTPGSLITTIAINSNVAETTVVDGTEQVKNYVSSTLSVMTIPVPSFTTTQIEVYAFNVTDSKAEVLVITPTPSISIPSFDLTQTRPPAFQDKGPSSTSGPIVLYVTPPPFPWKSDDKDNKPLPGPPPALPPIPVVTFRPGKPGPICKSGCGTPCVVFCAPCGLFGCGGCGLLGCGSNGQVQSVDTVGPEDDVDDDEIDEEEEEEEDDKCLLTGDPAGADSATEQAVDPGLSGVQPDQKPKPEPTSSQPPVSIAPAPPPPRPKPPPPPEPPSPNPDTEELKCYDKGSFIGRGTAINIINNFCGPDYWGGTRISDNVYIR